jgi:hypothetical protein
VTELITALPDGACRPRPRRFEARGLGDAAGVAHDRAILLRTCHRVELYVAIGDDDAAAIALPELPAGGRRLEGIAVARHLFGVAAGLDSVVIGEDQILHQLRDCLADRHIPGAARCPVEIGTPNADAVGLDPVLARLFQTSAHLGRETRSARSPRRWQTSCSTASGPHGRPAADPWWGGRMAPVAVAASRGRGRAGRQPGDRAAALARHRRLGGAFGPAPHCPS